MQFSVSDYEYMARALHLAKKGLNTAHPNPRVGCVIVNNNEIVGEGWHEYTGGPHAEVNALGQAGEQAEGATVYVTLEPCCHEGKTPPCTEALKKAGVAKVVAAMVDPHSRVAGNGLKELEAAGIETASGLLEAQAEALNPGFIKRMRFGRPYVRLKLAMSLDGRTAMASGESKWITSEAARLDVQRLRARSTAILTGVGTVLADDPAMTVRSEDVRDQPLRVVVDTHLSMPASAKMIKEPGETIVFTCSENEGKAELEAAGAKVYMMPFCATDVDLESVLDLMGEMEINEVLVETGATLSGAFLSAGLIDELVIYQAPILMGDSARPLFRLPGLDKMEQKFELDITDRRMVGKDMRITAKVVRK
ncbi:MAG: bifunctional diaminohydroxyphosphoribosylaminopyrimidine deaminase/5-amino-6-(5-phosphoribosylamino)uracil reductase RibD [Gammaproteobacteria bacterium]|nr:bifunctional diaminohydroxyphosphoribosylaminopyrimidine deaminase/5-amino-6-(5-phosphoribosylamino)uracil reductase RibD [Gammaproteobacteria bacterium]